MEWVAILVAAYLLSAISVVDTDLRRPVAERPAYARRGRLRAIFPVGFIWPVLILVRTRRSLRTHPRDVVLAAISVVLQLTVTSLLVWGLWIVSGLASEALWIRLPIMAVLLGWPAGIALLLLRTPVMLLGLVLTTPVFWVFPEED